MKKRSSPPQKKPGRNVTKGPASWPQPEFSVKGLNTGGVISMTQWEVLKINWLHAFFPRNCLHASDWNVLLCGPDLFNRKQKIPFAVFIINFSVAQIPRERVAKQ